MGSDPDLFPWEEPYVEDPRRLAADDELATLGQRIQNLNGALNAIYATRQAGHLPDGLAAPASEAVQAAIHHLVRVQQIEALRYSLDIDPLSDEKRAGVLDHLADLAKRFPEHGDRITR